MNIYELISWIIFLHLLLLSIPNHHRFRSFDGFKNQSYHLEGYDCFLLDPIFLILFLAWTIFYHSRIFFYQQLLCRYMASFIIKEALSTLWQSALLTQKLYILSKIILTRIFLLERWDTVLKIENIGCQWFFRRRV
jgi:hypothetical protein